MTATVERSLQYILDRCKVDEVSGCWEWSLAMSLDVPVCGRNIIGCSSAVKAAWLLSGRRLPNGHVVWRATCDNKRCVNPVHMLSGTRGQMRKWCGESGREKGDPARAAKNRITLAARAVPVDVVRQAEEMFATGAMNKTVFEALHLSKKTAMRIKAGRHVHSEGALLVKGASIFAMGGGK